MPKNIFIDLNVILDVLLERPAHKAAQAILELPEATGSQLFISAHTVTTFAYLLERAKVPAAEIDAQLSWLLNSFTVVPTTVELLRGALASPISDYEDAVIEQAALHCQAEIIVTRNLKDFAVSRVPAQAP